MIVIVDLNQLDPGRKIEVVYSLPETMLADSLSRQRTAGWYRAREDDKIVRAGFYQTVQDLATNV